MKRVLMLASAFLALIVTLVACGEDATNTPQPTATPVPQINEVSMSAFDFGFRGPDSIPAGMTTLTLVNEGQDLHHQQLVKLPEGMTAEGFLTALAEGGPEAPPPPGVVFAGGVSVLGPGGQGSVTLNLAEGAYVVVCFLPGPEGVPHFALGMSTPLTVTAPEAPLAAEPDAEISIDLVEFAFNISATIPSGTQTVRIVNRGDQDHEAFLVRLAPDAIADDFIAFVLSEGPPPGLPLGGIQAIASGAGGFFTADFEPGNYALICFIPDEETGTPHAFLGMVSEFTVQ